MDIEKALSSLKDRGFTTSYFPTAAEASDYLAGSISGVTVGIGGSVTITEMGLGERLAENNEVFWHHLRPGPDTITLASTAEVYITSANAISETGEIVNIDGRGNRAASTLFGHRKVYIVCGTNKLSPDLESAIHRARNIAAPKNAQRLKMQTPCAVKGDRCYDCRSPERICNGLVVLMAPMTGFEETEVVLIGEALGY